MHATPPRRLAVVLLTLGFVCTAAGRQAEKPRPVATARAPRELLTSPRDTLKTLYFAAVAYDFQPRLIDEAVACLDLDPERAANPGEAARLALDLEQILRTLCVPVHGLPTRPDRSAVLVHDADGFKITIARGTDGLWRFDRDTVNRIPDMFRESLAKFRVLQPDRAGMREGHHDPRATLRRFISDSLAKDFYSAARCLDLSGVERQQRGEKGPILAQQLAFIIQRRGWPFTQEVPYQTTGPAFTLHADASGRIVLERVRLDDGKEAWLFGKKTVRNIPAMYERVVGLPADWRYERLGKALPAVADLTSGKKPPDTVPPQLQSPRAVLKGFFRAMDAAETQDSRLRDALLFLDLQALPEADHEVQGTKVAIKLEAVLRKIRVELSALPDDWNAPPQLLGESQGVRVEITRQRDGCWRFNQDTVAQTAAFFDKVAAHNPKIERASHHESARETMATFLASMGNGDHDEAAKCLDLSRYRPVARDEIGPILAYKLKFVMDRIGRVYIQEVPDAPDGPRYVFYRGDLGRIVIARKTDGPDKGSWLFTAETVEMVGRMFRAAIRLPVNEASADTALPPPTFWQSPGIWVRFRVPEYLRLRVWKLQLYQWVGVVAGLLASFLVPRLLLAPVHSVIAFVLRKSGSTLSRAFVASRLRPLAWVIAWWLLFHALAMLDLPTSIIQEVLPFKTFGLAALLGVLGVKLVDLATAVYMNSELLRPHRSLSDMVVPVSMRTLKGGIFLAVAVYLIYQIGEGDALGRFLTGLGFAGLAASLAAQDAMKGFFSTLLLIGERTFKIGDRITVGDQEGVVEQVGFRATRLRTDDGSVLTIPNATITSAAIDNLSTKTSSRWKASMLLTMGASPEGALALRDQVRAWLITHPKVQSDKVEVTVNRLGGQSVEVALDVYLIAANATAEAEVKEEVNRELLRLASGGAAAKRAA